MKMNWLILATALVATGAVLTLSLLIGGDDVGRGRALSRVAPDQEGYEAGECISASATRADIRNLKSQRDDYSGIARLRPQEATALLAFTTVYPAPIQGWTTETNLLDETPGEPFRRCFLTTSINDTDHTGYAARVTVSPRPNSEIRLTNRDNRGWTEQLTTVQGARARLWTRSHDEPSVSLLWDQEDVRIAVSCTALTAEECMAIAETIR